MENIYKDTTWLPPAPRDFRSQLSEANTSEQLKILAGYNLNNNQLSQIGNHLNNLGFDHSGLSSLTSFSLGIVSNSTTTLLKKPTIGVALRYGIALNFIDTDFNQVAQEAFSESSSFSEVELDALVLALDYRGLPIDIELGDAKAAEKCVNECISYIKALAKNIHEKTKATIILQNFAPPVDNYFGSFEDYLPGTLSWVISQINVRLNTLRSDTLVILNIANLAANVGLLNWHDETSYNIGKMPFNLQYIPIYSDYVCRLIAAIKGKSRRCLILDLDNTLWGGVIGDDGMDGILIGQGNATAEAHLNVQKIVLALRSRGVVLAVSSKNEETVARKVFREHPDMILREDDIAVFQANWQDKASNIKAIAASLSLGLDSMVFLDDNPSERLLVRRELPEVAVPELPSDPALFGRTLLAAGYFEALAYTHEDSQRANHYQKNAERAQLMESSDLDSFLGSLNMEILFIPFNAIGRERIVQLVNKSNQFNLTTKRYNAPEIEALQKDDNYLCWQIRLTDRFGDNGIISVVICRKDDVSWEIDTWLMSCRVLGRDVEKAVLQELMKEVKKGGGKRLLGKFVPTSRNMVVKDHYNNLGFTLLKEQANGETHWKIDIGFQKDQNLPFQIKILAS